ncbi:MMPL family transporter [Clostridium paraputrificum]|jgi:predicted RND superfamily exporter protein|uniref:Antibiotic ABC transporter permease n=1 Tax=Clostridium paraputrificum TaxID=29363 RepID=A0A1B8RTL0_9CLOT|nr:MULTISPECIES: MMPL family transporter [Clostridium]MBS6886835.1 MMPL family transporter [Clostridium sp.]MDB2071113.1 MMPL family transporter [Clostridium paraputrificum]MDB2080888.1 MMPL family transporter [Clostridium paraputrificum]MDB2088786.1 MMPL family transporter [Clostridium paraputrificum]MDB2095227.1 MMPL family transporter [Clostridium paraputrificum]
MLRVNRISKFIADHAKSVIVVSLLLLIPSVIGFINTRVNYDLLSYLPQNLDSTKGEDILDKTYSDASIGIVIVEGMENKDINILKDKIEEVDGVTTTLGLTDVLDESIPKDILPDEIKNQLYNEDSTMFVIKFDGAPGSDSTINGISKVKKILNKQCFLSGMSAIMEDTKELAEHEAPFYVLIAVALSIVVLLISMESTVVPIIFLVSIGIGIVYNLGTNLFLGEISYITKALAAVLQLGVTMDYSIFLMHRYDEERGKWSTKEEAMTQAIKATMTSISGSSLTTIAGFLALCTMDLALGKDIGLVMAKGVVIGVICAITILPAFVLVFDKAIHKFKHKTIIPEFKKVSTLVTKHYKAFIVAFLVIMLPAFFGQANAKVYYNLDETLKPDMSSIVALNKMKDNFNMTSTHFIIVKDDIKSYKMKEMTDRIENLEGVTTVLSYDKFIGPNVPEDFIPRDIKEIFKQGGYNLLLVNSEYKSASDELNNQIIEMTDIVKSYDKDAMVTGEGALTKDLTTIADQDFKNVSVASIAAIFVIILIVFKSVSIPVLLVSAIEFAIFINMGIPYYTGTVIPFVASIVIGTIQLGATVDYAILLTSRFREEIRNGYEKKEAMRIAVQESAKSIVTSGLTFFGATGGVALVSDMALIKSLCFLMARGAIISMMVIIFVLPALLLVSEGIINKTTKGWKINKLDSIEPKKVAM